MKNTCPVSYDRVNENLLRLNSLVIFSAFVMVVLTPAQWMIIPITIDFAIRIFLGVEKSPLCILLQRILDTFNISPCMINAGPKRFAAKLGLAFSLLITLFFILNLVVAVKTMAGIMAILTGLEAFTGYCVGCKIYRILTNLGIRIR